MTEITLDWLKQQSACRDGYEWSIKVLNKKSMPIKEFINALMAGDRFDWANWVIVRVMDKPQKVVYAIYAAEQVIDIFEKKYPKDDRPRKAIEAAKIWLKNPCEEAESAAWSAVESAVESAARSAAESAWNSAWSAWNAARSAAESADSAWSARSAARSAWSAAESAARSAAESTWSVADDVARKQMQIRIINYGLSLLNDCHKAMKGTQQ